MFVFFLNLNKLEWSPEISEIGTSSLNPDHLDYLRKVCPHRSKKATDLSTAITKFQKHFKISQQQAKTIFKSFTDHNIIKVGYDDEVKIHILANSTRKHIFSLIKSYPGLYIKFIRSHLNLGSYQILWHLAFLLEFNYIRDLKIGRFRIYSEPCIELHIAIIGFLLLKDDIRKILLLLYQNPEGMAFSGIQQKLDKSKSTLHYTLNKMLVKWEIVVMVASINSRNYQLNPMYSSIVDSSMQKYKRFFDENETASIFI